MLLRVELRLLSRCLKLKHGGVKSLSCQSRNNLGLNMNQSVIVVEQAKEITQLKAEIERLKAENELLKQALNEVRDE
jgi:cell division protein FtsB